MISTAVAAVLSQLEADYCPPLDTALFTAIVSDYDLSTPSALQEVKAVLDPLKEDAALEEAAGFEPSGVAQRDNEPPDGYSQQSSNGLQSVDTSSTSISDDLSSLSISTGEPHQDLNILDEETKIALLHDVFGDQLREHTIQSTLRKRNSDWTSTLEELLTQVYYNDAEDSDGVKIGSKGVNGFDAERIPRSVKRKKARRKRISPSADTTGSDFSDTSVDSDTPRPSKWQTAKADVDFIANHIQRPAPEVRLKYNQHAAYLPATINAFLKEEMDKFGARGDEEETKVHAEELQLDFPAINPKYLLSLIRITHPSTAAAHELAKALTTKPISRSKASDLIPQYTRVTSADIDGSSTWHTVPRTTMMTHGSGSASSSSAGTYAAARAQAFAQASAAHRKSKSDRMYGGAAAYYSQVARDLGGLSASANASAMDALAEQQSSAAQVDLHGVDVLNGVRIARERVEAWWEATRESRASGRLGAGDRGAGFSIVVGRGTHSEGGKSKLGPAVSKMLRTEGWRTQDNGAVLVVRGKAK